MNEITARHRRRKQAVEQGDHLRVDRRRSQYRLGQHPELHPTQSKRDPSSRPRTGVTSVGLEAQCAVNGETDLVQLVWRYFADEIGEAMIEVQQAILPGKLTGKNG